MNGRLLKDSTGWPPRGTIFWSWRRDLGRSGVQPRWSLGFVEDVVERYKVGPPR